jgi:hypothetical protein
MKKFLALIAISFSMVGCASVNMADAQKDAQAKRFEAPKDQAAVYIYRNETMGAAIKMEVVIDGKAVGQTAANTYLYTVVAPGKHTVTSNTENTDSLEFEAKPGMLYYIWQEVKMGLMSARSKLHLVSEAEGKKGVQETKLIDTQ